MVPLFSGLSSSECDISLPYLFRTVCKEKISVTKKKAFSHGISDHVTSAPARTMEGMCVGKVQAMKGDRHPPLLHTIWELKLASHSNPHHHNTSQSGLNCRELWVTIHGIPQVTINGSPLKYCWKYVIKISGSGEDKPALNHLARLGLGLVSGCF